MMFKKTAPSRRALLATGAGAALTALAASGTARAALPAEDKGGAAARLRALEEEHGAKLGVYGRNLATGRTVRHRGGELFAICSVFKPLAAAAILRDLDQDGEFLARRIHYTQAEVLVNSPVTELKENVANGLTVAELCDAAITRSDNTAGNLLLKQVGGPTGITRFCRSLGDTVTRLDRWETALNSAEPWRVTDTTTPYAIARTYAHLTLGQALAPQDSERLTHWLLNNKTSGERFRAGLPDDWRIADKTGGGDYASNNNVGIAWTPDGTPLVLAVLTRKPEQKAMGDNPLVRKTAALLAEVLV